MALYEYVTRDQLSGFDKYKYSAVDSNPLSVYVMHPFWNSVVKVMPRWLAPNLITFTGFMFLVFNFLMLSFYDYHFDASAEGYSHVPSWVWVAAGLFNFLAYTLDGVDGKQARRTNSSTPLGELFDHGLDSWACVFFVATVYSIFGRGPSGVGVATLYYILWVVLFSFILSHWEKYNTGILFLPWGYDISQVVSRKHCTPHPSGFSLFNSRGASRSNTLKHSSMYEAFLPFLSPVLLFLLSSVWVIFSPSNILHQQPRVFYLMVGTAFANVTCKLIVCQMSNTRCQPLSWLLVPMATVVLLAVTGLVANETLLIYVWTAVVILTHIHYGVSVVSVYTHTTHTHTPHARTPQTHTHTHHF
uniref:Ethanolaminephosphotransferase 1 n=1 Tax=Salmo trutta TaxID=8032 RepID=A0A673ZS05_SALTR